MYEIVFSKYNLDLTLQQRIFGTAHSLNLVLWVANFTIYKAHLQGCEGIVVEPEVVFDCEAQKYEPLFNVLTTLL